MSTFNRYTIIKRIMAISIVCAMAFSMFFGYGVMYRANTEDEFVTMIKTQFPESYWEPLIALHKKHPNWVFKPVNTDVDWVKFVEQDQMYLSRNLVYASSVLINGKWTKTPTTWKEVEMTGAYNWADNTWVGWYSNQWNQASKELVAYSIDPRNWLTEDMVFMFQELSYDSSYQTYDILKQMMENSFMDCDYAIVGGTEQNTLVLVGNGESESYEDSTTEDVTTEPSSTEDTSTEDTSTEDTSTEDTSTEDASTEETTPEDSTTEEPTPEPPTEPVKKGKDYAEVLIEAAEKYGVSPLLLCARLLQEKKGVYNPDTNQYELDDPLGEGVKASDGVVYYNLFNIKADGTDVIKNGIAHAKSQGWNSQYKAIMGGAKYISEEFIKGGLDTLYFQKFNYKKAFKQYMQNITAPVTEGGNIYKNFKNVGALELPFVFNIPVYNNMPETVCPMPEIKYGNPNYKLKDMVASGTDIEGGKVELTLTPTFAMDTDTYSIIVPYEVNKIDLKATPIADMSTIIGAGTHDLVVGENIFDVVCQSEFGTTKKYTVNVTRKEGSMYLTMLNTSLGNFVEEFDKLKFEYSMTVDNTVETIDINYGAESIGSYIECIVGEKVIIPKDGTISAVPLVEGLNEISINVYPNEEDKTLFKTYKISITKFTNAVFDPLELQFNEETKVINGFEIGDTVEIALSKMAVANGTLAIVDKNGKAKELTDIIATGDSVVVYEGSGFEVERYTILIYGELSGDGKINLLDFVIIKNQILKGDRLEGVFLEAANVRPKTEGVDLLDFVGMKNYILKGTVIEQIRQVEEVPDEEVSE